MSFPLNPKRVSTLGEWVDTRVLAAGHNSIGICIFKDGATIRKHKKRIELEARELQFLIMSLKFFAPNLYTLEEAKRKILMEEI